MRRRTLLLGAIGGAIGGLASACGTTQASTLRVELLDRSIPAQVIKAFRKQVQPGTRLAFDGASQLSAIFQQLQQWQQHESLPPPIWRRWLPLSPSSTESENQPSIPNLVTLGDYWLPAAITQELIQPIAVEALSQWSQLPAMWRDWVIRNANGKPDPQGQVWGAPYRVQSLMLAYQKPVFDRLHWQPTQWSDLWRPELAGRIAILNHPRIILSLVLKVLGQSINDEAAIAQPEVQLQLEALFRQVRTFDSDTYLKALINEDIWIAVGWSSDILAAMNRYQTLGATFPQEGTLFTADLWVKPAKANRDVRELTDRWIDFCWQPSVATQISISSQGISPLFLGSNQYPEVLNNQIGLLPDQEILAQSELLYPLSETGQNLLGTLIGSIA